MGSFVDVDCGYIQLDDMQKEIQDIIKYTQGYADLMKLDLADSIENLEKVVGNYTPEALNINIDDVRIVGPDFPNRIFAPLELDDSWPSDLPPAPILEEYGVIDFSYVAPTPPPEIDSNFNWSVSEYTSNMWLALFNKVHTDIIDGGTGLSDAVHAIIVAREQFARQANHDREYRRGLNAVGTSGFNLPSGQVAAFQRDVISDLAAQDQDALNNITVKDFDMATENTRFAITSGVEMEKVLRDTYQFSEKLGLEAAKATKQYLIDVYNANVSAYLARWEGVKLGLEALQTKISAISTRNESVTNIYQSRASVYKTEVDAIAVKNKGIVDARLGDISAYTAEIEAVAKQYESLIEEANLNMKAQEIEVNATIEEAKVNLEAYTSQAELAKGVSESVANIAAQAIASALGAINTSLSNGYHASEGRSTSCSSNESISESHSYTES